MVLSQLLVSALSSEGREEAATHLHACIHLPNLDLSLKLPLVVSIAFAFDLKITAPCTIYAGVADNTSPVCALVR